MRRLVVIVAGSVAFCLLLFSLSTTARAQVTCPTITSNSAAAVFASFSPDGAPTSCTVGLSNNLAIAVDGGSAVNGTSGFTASNDRNVSFLPATIVSGPCFTDSSVFTNLVKPSVATGQAYSCILQFSVTIGGQPYTLRGTFRGIQFSTAIGENFQLTAGTLPVSSSSANSLATRMQRSIRNSISRRADQIAANEPDLARRLSQAGSASVGAPVNFAASGTTDNNRLAFSSSLRQIIASKKAAKDVLGTDPNQMMALGQNSLVSYGKRPSGFDIWAQGKWAHVNDGTRENDIGLLYLGIDYRMSANLVVGVLVQMDRTDEKDSIQSTAVDGTGWLAGPYVVARLHENLIFDARGAWGQSSNSIELTGTSTGSFDTTRWLARARMTGDFNQGLWHFAPHVGVIYIEDRQDTFTDSLGSVIGSQTVSLGRLTFGPKLSYRIRSLDGTVISPHIAIDGIWDFEKAEIVDVSTGSAAGSDDLRGRVEGGVSARMANGWSVSGTGFYDGIGASNLDIFGGSVKVSVPLN